MEKAIKYKKAKIWNFLFSSFFLPKFIKFS